MDAHPITQNFFCEDLCLVIGSCDEMRVSIHFLVSTTKNWWVVNRLWLRQLKKWQNLKHEEKSNDRSSINNNNNNNHTWAYIYSAAPWPKPGSPRLANTKYKRKTKILLFSHCSRPYKEDHGSDDYMEKPLRQAERTTRKLSSHRMKVIVAQVECICTNCNPWHLRSRGRKLNVSSVVNTDHSTLGPRVHQNQETSGINVVTRQRNCREAWQSYVVSLLTFRWCWVWAFFPFVAWVSRLPTPDQ